MNTRVIVVHQPHFLPWLGYFNKLAWTDIFVVLDDIQYRRSYFQNRTLLKNADGRTFWFTVPVHAPLPTQINEVQLTSGRWKEKFRRTMFYAYGKTQYYHQIIDVLENACSPDETSLLRINVALLRAVIQLLQWNHVVITFASSIVPASAMKMTDRISEICGQLGGTHYIFGEGRGTTRHNPDDLRSIGITPIFQQFQAHHPVYSQVKGPFTPRLSVLDILFNMGPTESAKRIRDAWHPTISAPAVTSSNSLLSQR